MGLFDIISYTDQEQDFLNCLENTPLMGLPNSEQFTLESHYRRAEFGDKNFKDLSFLIKGEQGVESVILAHKIHDHIGFYGSGVCIFEQNYNKKRTKRIIDFLCQQAAQEKCKTLKIDDVNISQTLSLLGQEAFNYKAAPNLKLRVTQDLSLSKENLFLEIRDRYRSYINKSKKEIRFDYVNCNDLNRNLFDDFRVFHKETAGRQTRPIESWDAQFEMIKSGHAELVLGYIEPYGLVSSALFTDYGHTTYYAVGVYDRSLFEKPLAHANLYEGMLRAKNRGQAVFDLGVIPSYDTDYQKEYNIGKFKKGFSKTLSSFIEWNIIIL